MYPSVDNSFGLPEAQPMNGLFKDAP